MLRVGGPRPYEMYNESEWAGRPRPYEMYNESGRAGRPCPYDPPSFVVTDGLEIGITKRRIL